MERGASRSSRKSGSRIWREERPAPQRNREAEYGERSVPLLKEKKE